MNLEQLKKHAYSQDIDPMTLPAPERSFYLMAATLYDEVKSSAITQGAGTQQMLVLERKLHADTETDRINKKIAQLWKKIEQPAREYAHNPTIENADHFFASVYGLPDTWRKNKHDSDKP